MTARSIRLLDGGSLVIDHSQLMWNINPGIPVRVPVYSVLVDHPDALLLYDTGFDGHLAQEKVPHEQPEQTAQQTIPAQLALCGLTPTDIDVVVNSHIHFDHVGGNSLFPHATLVVSEDELRQARNPPVFEVAAYLDRRFDQFARIREISGDTEVLPGVHLIATPGHTVGHYSMLVEIVGRRPLLFTGDATYTQESLDRMAVTGFHNDPTRCVQSMERLKDVAETTGAELFFPHDPDLYPAYRHAPNAYF